MKKPALPSGQALLIIVLVMSVALTIGLAVISRSITDIRISSQEEESARVFSVVEAGIEQALKLGYAPPGGVTIGDITAMVTESNIGGGTEFVFPNQIEPGDTQTVWLVNHDAAGEMIESPAYTAASLNVCWEDTNPDETALEVSIFYKHAGEYRIARGAYDFEAIADDNSFEVPSGGSGNCPAGLGRKKTLTWSTFGIDPVADAILFLRLKPLYNKAKIGVVGLGGAGGNLPSQGTCFESAAKLATSGVAGRARQCQFHKSPPAVFDYVLFSGGDLSK